MSVGLWLAAATLPALLVGAYLLWWVDRYAWEPAPRFLLTSALAAAGVPLPVRPGFMKPWPVPG